MTDYIVLIVAFTLTAMIAGLVFVAYRKRMLSMQAELADQLDEMTRRAGQLRALEYENHWRQVYSNVSAIGLSALRKSSEDNDSLDDFLASVLSFLDVLYDVDYLIYFAGASGAQGSRVERRNDRMWCLRNDGRQIARNELVNKEAINKLIWSDKNDLKGESAVLLRDIKGGFVAVNYQMVKICHRDEIHCLCVAYGSRGFDQHDYVHDTVLQQINYMIHDKMTGAKKPEETPVSRGYDAIQTCFNSSTSLVCIRDINGNYRYLNPANTVLCGEDPKLWIGRNIKDMFAANRTMALELIQHDQQVFSGFGGSVLEEEYFHHDGSKRTYLTERFPLYDTQGKVEYVFAYSVDITDRKSAENRRVAMEKRLQHSQRMESLGYLAGGIAHDFNNILGAIIGFSDLLLQRYVKEDAGKVYNYLIEILHAGERAQNLVAQIMSFSRTKPGASESMNIIPIVKEMAKMMATIMPANIVFENTVNPALPNVIINPADLNQLYLNLCINSKEAVKDGGRITTRLDIARDPDVMCSSCHKLMAKGEYVELRIEDTGKGIEQDIIMKIFDPYFSTKDKADASGMGLSVVHGIVHNHHGHVYVHSNDKGTAISVYLPVHKSQSIISEPHSHSPVSRESILAHKNIEIMVVDDERTLVTYLMELLENSGYKVTAFYNATDAIDYFNANHDHVHGLITDQTMPGMSGVELVKRVFLVNPYLPVMLCTGYSEVVDESLVKQLGIKIYLNKPIKADALLSGVETMVSGVSLAQESVILSK